MPKVLATRKSQIARLSMHVLEKEIINFANIHYLDMFIFYFWSYIIEEIMAMTANEHTARERSRIFEERLSRPAIFTQLKCFQKEISATRLATAARACIAKQQNDYKIGCFLYLSEWRSRHSQLDLTLEMDPQARTFTTIIDDNNVFSPIIYETMAHNNVALSAHLHQLLCLTSNDPQYIHEDTAVVELFDNEYVKNEDVMELITQLNLPAFISIDASLEGTSDTTSVNIVIPDVQPEDVEKEWQHCPAKTILTRIWKLPSQWGTGTTCINMAEALGFIIGDYTIPHNMPVMYITDSDNARTLQ